MGTGAPFGNHPGKIDRYRAFWQRAPVDRPLVGFSFKSWFPLREYGASAVWEGQEHLTPDMVDPEAFLDDQERLLREGETLDDDILRGASPSQAVPWLAGMLGARLRILPGSILGETRHLPWEALEDVHLDREHLWFGKYIAFARHVARARPERARPIRGPRASRAPAVAAGRGLLPDHRGGLGAYSPLSRWLL
jgi:hypothetical protein